MISTSKYLQKLRKNQIKESNMERISIKQNQKLKITQERKALKFIGIKILSKKRIERLKEYIYA